MLSFGWWSLREITVVADRFGDTKFSTALEEMTITFNKTRTYSCHSQSNSFTWKFRAQFYKTQLIGAGEYAKRISAKK